MPPNRPVSALAVQRCLADWIAGLDCDQARSHTMFSLVSEPTASAGKRKRRADSDRGAGHGKSPGVDKKRRAMKRQRTNLLNAILHE